MNHARLPIRLLLTGLLIGHAGCAQWHLADGDAGAVEADGGLGRCQRGEAPPTSAYCFSIDATHVCGDAGTAPTCIDGAWACAPGTAHLSDCWCSALAPHSDGCTCTPSGWSCPDATDAGISCPANSVSLANTPCSIEGATCGECPHPCSGTRCDLVTCRSGRWQGSWHSCPAIRFPCGPTTCSAWTEYCEHTASDVAGVPDTYVCQAYPASCMHDCSCFAELPGNTCVQGSSGVTLTIGG